MFPRPHDHYYSPQATLNVTLSNDTSHHTVRALCFAFFEVYTHFFLIAYSPYAFLPSRPNHPPVSPMTLSPSAARLESVNLVHMRLYADSFIFYCGSEHDLFLFPASRALLSAIR
jgi:hypothetical protein